MLELWALQNKYALSYRRANCGPVKSTSSSRMRKIRTHAVTIIRMQVSRMVSFKVLSRLRSTSEYALTKVLKRGPTFCSKM